MSTTKEMDFVFLNDDDGVRFLYNLDYPDNCLPQIFTPQYSEDISFFRAQINYLVKRVNDFSQTIRKDINILDEKETIIKDLQECNDNQYSQIQEIKQQVLSLQKRIDNQVDLIRSLRETNQSLQKSIISFQDQNYKLIGEIRKLKESIQENNLNQGRQNEHLVTEEELMQESIPFQDGGEG